MDPNNQGMTFDSAPAQQDTPAGGMTFDASPVHQDTPAGGQQPNHSDEMQIDSNAPWYKQAAQAAGSAFEGVGEGVFSTAAGAADMVNNIDRHIGGSAHQLPTALTGELHHLAGDDNTPGSSNVFNKMGYGGETLLEFMLGDEALKGLPLAKRLEIAAKTTKTLEGSSRVMRALQVGASVLKQASLHGAEAGVVQSGQTLARSGGDVKEAAKQGAIGALAGGATDAVLGTAGELLGRGGKAAEAAKRLDQVAQEAPTRGDIVQSLSDKAKAADELHSNEYQAGLNKMSARAGTASVDAADNPLAKRAQEVLGGEPVPGEHPYNAQEREALGEGLTPKVKKTLQMYATGVMPEVKGAVEGAEKPTGLVDASGKPVTSADTTGDTQKTAPPLTFDQLVQSRQNIRKMASEFDYGDVNSRVLRSLINAPDGELSPLDQTIDKLVQDTGDDKLAQDYRDLRSTYRVKLQAFNNPVIQKVMQGNESDAANDFITQAKEGGTLAGKKAGNIEDLKTVLGDDGVHEFGTQIIQGMLKDTSFKGTGPDGKAIYGEVNPSKFMSLWNKVSKETQGSGLFDFTEYLKDPNNPASKGLKSLMSDAQSAANLQRLNRIGIFGGAGALLGLVPIPHVGAIGSELGIGLLGSLGLLSEAKGVQTGRNILDYIADHPAVWATYRGLGKAASSKAAGAVADAARIGATTGAAAAVASSPDNRVRQNTYNKVRQSLSGNGDQPALIQTGATASQ